MSTGRMFTNYNCAVSHTHTLNVYAAQSWFWKRSSHGETKTAVELAGCSQESRARALEA
jgi:hypothetical protein